MAASSIPIINHPKTLNQLIRQMARWPDQESYLAAGQRCSREDCFTIIEQSLRTFFRDYPQLNEKFPNFLEQNLPLKDIIPPQVWEIIPQAIFFQRLKLAQASRPSLDQLKELERELQLNREFKERAQVSSQNKNKHLSLENLSVEEQLEMISRAQAYEGFQQQVKQKVKEALSQGLPEETPLPMPEEAIEALADNVAEEITELVAKDLQAGGELNQETVRTAIKVVKETPEGSLIFANQKSEEYLIKNFPYQKAYTEKAPPETGPQPKTKFIPLAGLGNFYQDRRQFRLASAPTSQQFTSMLTSPLTQSKTPEPPEIERFRSQLKEYLHLRPSQAQRALDLVENGLLAGQSAKESVTFSLVTLNLATEGFNLESLNQATEDYERFLNIERAKASPITPEKAFQADLAFQEKIAQGNSSQAALIEVVNSLDLTQEEADNAYENLRLAADDYAITVKSLGAHQPGDPSPQFLPLPKQALTKINQATGEEIVINANALDFYQRGITPEAFDDLVQKSRLNQAINPDLVAQTKKGLSWLYENSEVAGSLGISSQEAGEEYLLNFDQPDSRLANRPQLEIDFLNRQLETAQKMGFRNLPKIIGLKWQKGLANFALKHPKLAGLAGFISSPKKYIKTKVASKLMGAGLRWAGKKGLKGLGKGLLKLGAKIAGKGLGKVIGGAIGSLIPVPVLGTLIGVAVGAVIDFAINKTAGFLKKHGKKIMAAVLALHVLIFGLLAKLAAVLPALATGLGILLLGTPYAPLGALLTGLGIFGLGRQLGSWLGSLGKGGGLGTTLGGLGTGIGNALGLGTTASLPGYIALAPAAALGAVVFGSFLYTISLNNAFVLMPTEGTAETFQEPRIIDEDNFDCDHPACQVASLVKELYGGEVTSNNVGFVAISLAKENILSPEAILELVKSVENFRYLQCGGFKKAVEKDLGISFPAGNPVSFLKQGFLSGTNCQESEAEVGANAIWGPIETCKAGNYQAADSQCNQGVVECCGHMGVITKVLGNEGVYVTSASTNYHGSIDTRLFSKENITMIIKCQ